MVSVFDVSNKKESQTFTVINEDDKDVSLEVVVTSRSIDAKGNEKREKSKDFIFYPPQFVLKKGQRRNIRLSWVGGQKLDHEKAYRLIVRQLPVDTQIKKVTSQGAQINFVFEYVASVYARPPKTRAHLQVKSLKKLDDQKVFIILENTGSQHQLVNEYNIYFKNPKNNKKYELSKNEREIFASLNLLAHSTREITLNYHQALPEDIQLILEKK